MAKGQRQGEGESFRFRVSDAFEVPLRGYMLRLRTIEGAPRLDDVAPGRTLRLSGPAGQGRDVTVLYHAATGGRQTQKRLDQIRELDIVISAADAGEGADRADIGWTATGPARG